MWTALLVALLSAGPAHAQAAEPPVDEAALAAEREPFDALHERMLGSASRAVRFDWRRSPVALGVIGSDLLERNNFGSSRLGLIARRPFGRFMGEVGLARVFTRGSDSSRKLALTPYRQYGRPDRYELDVNAGFPLAEGVVTAWPGFFPAVEMVFSANAGFRYLLYPGSQQGATFLEVARSVLAPRFSDAELDRLEGRRLPGMQVDSARYGLLGGLSLDLYFKNGAFASPRALVALPLLSPLTGTRLGLWWELSLGLGWAF